MARVMAAAVKADATLSLQRAREASEGVSGHAAAWPPLASSPSALTGFTAALGVEVTALQFVDVLGLEEDLLGMLPGRCLALVLLYPTTVAVQAHLDALEARAPRTMSAAIFFRQLYGGTCGTLATLHAVVNGARALPAADALLGVTLRTELLLDEAAAEGVAAAERLIERRSHAVLASAAIRLAHERAAIASSAATARAGERQGRHFLTFVAVDGRLILLDGRRHAPIDCGGTSEEGFLAHAVAEVRGLFAAAANDHDGTGSDHHAFSLMALVGDR